MVLSYLPNCAAVALIDQKKTTATHKVNPGALSMCRHIFKFAPFSDFLALLTHKRSKSIKKNNRRPCSLSTASCPLLNEVQWTSKWPFKSGVQLLWGFEPRFQSTHTFLSPERIKTIGPFTEKCARCVLELWPGRTFATERATGELQEKSKAFVLSWHVFITVEEKWTRGLSRVAGSLRFPNRKPCTSVLPISNRRQRF